MAELAELGGGRLLDYDPKAWSVKVDPRGSRIIEYGWRAIWDRWWMMVLLLGLLTVAWGLRRRWIGGRSGLKKPSNITTRYEQWESGERPDSSSGDGGFACKKTIRDLQIRAKGVKRQTE